jgi:ABC-type hemin transport system ATPase subunit
VLADESVPSLDPVYELDAMAILRAKAARGASVVVSLHDLGLAARFGDRVAVLVGGGRRAGDGRAAARRDRRRLRRRLWHRHDPQHRPTGCLEAPNPMVRNKALRLLLWVDEPRRPRHCSAGYTP